MLVSLGILLGSSHDFLCVLGRLSMIFELVAGLIDSEADFALEYLGHDLAAFVSCFEVVLARVIVVVICSVLRTSLVLSLSLLVM